MGSLEDLGLPADEVIETPDEIPEESSGYVPLVQPGTYVFQLPDNMDTIFKKLDPTGSRKATRISAGFGKDSPLTIFQDDTFNGFYRGYSVLTFVNNIEFRRGPKSGDGVEVSDMQYLIRALEANLPIEQKTKLVNNQAYGVALRRQAGKLFKAQLHWETYCNPNKNIYVATVDQDGKRKVDEAVGTLGCKAKYTSYSRNPQQRIPLDPETGLFKERFDEIEVHRNPAGCPAALICNIRLSRFAPVTK